MLRGQSGSDIIYGGAGNDLLAGGSSSDILRGDEGQDRLRGERGNDTLYGGADQDYFEFYMNRNSGVDRIMDFEDGVDLFKMKKSGGTTFEDLIVRQQDSHTMISWEKGTILVMENHPSLIGPEDFLFS